MASPGTNSTSTGSASAGKLAIVLLISQSSFSQLHWTNVDSLYLPLPPSVHVFKSTDLIEGKPNISYYVVADLNEKKIEIKELLKRVDDLQKSNDSIAMEILPIQIELGRYQVAYEIFKERNPKAASQYGDIISEETE